MTTYLMIALAILIAALGVLGKLYTAKLEEFGRLEATYEVQRGETKKALAIADGLRLQHVAQVEKFKVLQDWKGAEDVRYRKQIRRLEERRDTSVEAAAKFPERFSRIATYNLRRGMRDVCRAGGGSPADCKIEIPKSPASKPGPADQSDTGNNAGVGGAAAGGAGQP